MQWVDETKLETTEERISNGRKRSKEATQDARDNDIFKIGRAILRM